MMPNLFPACPVCGRRGSEAAETCLQCGTNLVGYLRQYFRPWHCYNQALERLAQGQLAAAAREAYVAVVLNPEQPDFRLLMSHLLAGQCELDEAIVHAEAADELKPGSEEIESWLESLLARKYAAKKTVESVTEG